MTSGPSRWPSRSSSRHRRGARRHRAVGLSPPHVATTGVLQRRRLVRHRYLAVGLAAFMKRHARRGHACDGDRAGRRSAVWDRGSTEWRLRAWDRGPTPRGRTDYIARWLASRSAQWWPSGSAFIPRPRSLRSSPSRIGWAGPFWSPSGQRWCRYFQHVRRIGRSLRLRLTTVLSFAVLGVCGVS